MSYFVYISHRDPVDALVVARKAMEHGHYPFVPQLNKLIPGRKDEAWENYFKMWLFRCDVIYLTPSYRKHEQDWAVSCEIPVVINLQELNSLKLQPYIGLGTEFGKAVSKDLPEDEEWRKRDKAEVLKELTDVAGLGADPLKVGQLVIKAWDRDVNG